MSTVINVTESESSQNKTTQVLTALELQQADNDEPLSSSEHHRSAVAWILNLRTGAVEELRFHLKLYNEGPLGNGSTSADSCTISQLVPLLELRKGFLHC